MLRVSGLTKIYGGGASGVREVSFTVEAGEFFTLLGPSGCGKTTTLRCIAGLEEPSAGEIEIGGKLAYSSGRGIAVPTAKRDISMVFQSYAIWPHMTVGQNVAFPLEAQRMPAATIKRRVAEALQTVGLEGLSDRSAPLLSGGQQQRVALARAIVKGAAVLLLDEPLSNLDAHLREQMRAELRDLQRRIRITTIYVTHDQEEALSLSDRIAIMRDGRIEELDTPSRLYFAPRSAFTAHFIGHAEVWPCRVLDRAGEAIVVDSPLGRITSRCFPEHIGRETALAVRPEHIEIAAAEDVNGAANVIAGTVERENFSGRLVEYVVKTAAGTTVRAQCTSAMRWRVGTPVTLRLAPERCIVVNGVPATR